MTGITSRQREALAFIEGYIGSRGFSPNYAEIKEAIGLKSKSGVSRIIDQLEERGRIVRMPNRARSIQIAGRA